MGLSPCSDKLPQVTTVKPMYFQLFIGAPYPFDNDPTFQKTEAPSMLNTGTSTIFCHLSNEKKNGLCTVCHVGDEILQKLCGDYFMDFVSFRGPFFDSDCNASRVVGFNPGSVALNGRKNGVELKS